METKKCNAPFRQETENIEQFHFRSLDPVRKTKRWISFSQKLTDSTIYKYT